MGLAVAGFLAGFVVDRFSRKTVIVGSVLVYSLGTRDPALVRAVRHGRVPDRLGGLP
ncbi:hypothetical protein [Georgenia sp. SUBG003]|uniref:hypothetical protein n=1 Tax=Georgenia sp. SUBG003 TaxID=1497974 RepID=UPI003AB10D3A